MGVTECDNMLMLLGVSTKMTEKERDVVIPLMIRGFKVSKNKNKLHLINLKLLELLILFILIFIINNFKIAHFI